MSKNKQRDPSQINEWPVYTWSYIVNNGKWTKMSKPATQQALTAGTPTKTLRLVTFNLWFDEYERVVRFRAFSRLMMDLKPDIICLQEVIPSVCAALGNSDWVRKDYFISDCAGATVGRYGVVMLVKKRHESTLGNHQWILNNFRQFPFDNSYMGRSVLMANMIINQQPFVISTSHFESLNAAEERENQQAQTYHILAHVLGDTSQPVSPVSQSSGSTSAPPTVGSGGKTPTPPSSSIFSSLFQMMFNTTPSQATLFDLFERPIPPFERLPSARNGNKQPTSPPKPVNTSSPPSATSSPESKTAPVSELPRDFVGHSIVCGDFNFDSTRNFISVPGVPLENDMLERQLKGFSDVWIAVRGYQSREDYDALEQKDLAAQAQSKQLQRTDSDAAVDAFTAALSEAAANTGSSSSTSTTVAPSKVDTPPTKTVSISVASPSAESTVSSPTSPSPDRPRRRSSSTERKSGGARLSSATVAARSKMGWTIDTNTNAMLENHRRENMRYDRVMFKGASKPVSPLRGSISSKPTPSSTNKSNSPAKSGTWRPVRIELLGHLPIPPHIVREAKRGSGLAEGIEMTADTTTDNTEGKSVATEADDIESSKTRIHISDHFGLVADFVWE